MATNIENEMMLCVKYLNLLCMAGKIILVQEICIVCKYSYNNNVSTGNLYIE